MRYTLIGLLSWPLIFGLRPFVGAWADLAAMTIIPALWVLVWRLEFGSLEFWKQGGDKP